jgi:hypothetical protein
MQKISFLLLGIITISFSVFSQNVMWIDSTSAGPNQTVNLSLKISNSETFTAFQVDILLPPSLTYIPNSAHLTSRANGHTLATSLVNSQTLRILAFSLSNNTFFGNSGAVLTFSCQTKTQPGNYQILLLNSIIVDTLQRTIPTSTYPGNFILLAPKIVLNVDSINFGEVPLGGYIDKQIVISNTGTSPLIIKKLSSTHPEIQFLDTSTTKINPGNSINRIVRFKPLIKGNKNGTLKIYNDDPNDSIKSVPFKAYAFTVNEIRVGSTFGRSGYETSLRVRINNMEPFVAFEFNLLLPSVMKYVKGSAQLTSRKTDHLVFADTLPGNILQVVAFSPSNSSFIGNDGDIVELKFYIQGNGGVYYIPINNPIISDSTGTNIISASYPGTLEIAAPKIQLSQSIIDFDSVSIKDTVKKSLQVTNIGSDTLKIYSITIDNQSFSLETTTPISLAPNQNQNIYIRFHNSIKGHYEALLTIRHNDISQNPSFIKLTATAFAPNRLRVVPKVGKSKDTITVPFEIINTEKFVAFQFDVTLPQGIRYVNGSARLSSRAVDHVISASILPNGLLRILAFSLSQKSFKDDSGEVAQIKVYLEPDSGEYLIKLNNVIISDSLNRNISTGFDNGYIKIFSPPPAPSLAFPPNGAIYQPTSLTLFWFKSQNALNYHLQLSTDSTFNVLLVNDSTIIDTLKKIDSLKNLTKYYWRVRAGNIVGFGPYSEIWEFTTIGVLNMTRNFSAKWNLVGIPLSIDSTLSSMFSDDVSTFYIYTYTFKEGYKIDTTFTLGKGFWLGFLDSAVVDFSGTPVKDTISTDLDKYWNIISIPYLTPITKGNIFVERSGVKIPFDSAVSSGWISSSLFGYDPRTKSYYLSDTLEPWLGYWFATLKDSLKLIYTPSSTAPSPKVIFADVKSDDRNWNVILSARLGEVLDKLAFFGVRDGASDGIDRFDYPKPPLPPGEKAIQVYFYHPEWNFELEPYFASDIRASFGDVKSWKFYVRCLSGGEVRLSWDLSQVPGRFNFTLFDVSSGRVVDMRSVSEYVYNAVNDETREFRIDAVTGVSEENTIPKSYALYQNYPNPFNPSTTIEFDIPEKTNVKLIIYDILGREIETLIDKELEPGKYKLNFNATDLPSSVYFYTLKTPKFTKTNKMLLIK